MPFVKAIQSWLALNHIGRVEQAYQERMLGRRRNWRTWIQRRVVDAALIAAIFLALLSAVGMLLQVDIGPFLDEVPLLLIFPPMVAIILHFGLLIRTLAYSSNSITRERQQQSWEILLLTGVDSRQIVIGKWVATIRSLWPPLLRLAVLRASVVVYVGLALYNPFRWSSAYPDGYAIITPTVFHIALAIGFILVATVANIWFTAACGVSASARHQSAGVSLARGIGIRLGIIGVLVGASVAIVFVVSRIYIDNSAMRFIAELFTSILGALASLLDNGATLGATYLTSRIGEPDDQRLQAYQVLAMVILVLLYLGLTRLLLGRTIRHLIKQGALPPQPRPAVSQRAPLETTPSSMV